MSAIPRLPEAGKDAAVGAVSIYDATGRLVEVLTVAEFRARVVEQPCVRHGRLQCRNCVSYRYALMEKIRAARRRMA